MALGCHAPHDVGQRDRVSLCGRLAEDSRGLAEFGFDRALLVASSSERAFSSCSRDSCCAMSAS